MVPGLGCIGVSERISKDLSNPDKIQKRSPFEPSRLAHNLETRADVHRITSFFPWLDDAGHQNLTTKVIKRFPLLGAVGIFGSALTCLLSWLTLFFFNGHSVITGGHLPKPAAWLSVILSLNGILVHMAVAQGIAVTWWYRASRPQTTVKELHNTWATGSSVFSAVTIYKAFNYVALATIFVATLPVNGILLQNAVTSGIKYQNTDAKTIIFGIADVLPAGYSAQMNPDGSLGVNNQQWANYMPTVINNADGLFKSNNTLNTCLGDCNTAVAAVGFNSTCIDSTMPYNLPYDNTVSNDSTDSRIFSLDIGWSTSTPNTMFVNTIHKPDATCSGDLQLRNCTLQMARVNATARVLYNSTGDLMWYWYPTANMLTMSHRATIYYNSEILSFYPETDKSTSTTFGGIATALSSYFKSSITFHPTTNNTSLKSEGFYAQQLQPTTIWNQDGAEQVINKCNESYLNFGWFSHPSDYILDQIRTTLFYTGISVAENYVTNLSSPTSEPLYPTQYAQVATFAGEYTQKNVYRVVWRYWGASVAVTLAILIFILPTFYGFWTLARKTTLSPFETARAFHAPILKDTPQNMDTKMLLKVVGKENLHSEVVVSGDSSPVEKTDQRS